MSSSNTTKPSGPSEIDRSDQPVETLDDPSRLLSRLRDHNRALRDLREALENDEPCVEIEPIPPIRKRGA